MGGILHYAQKSGWAALLLLAFSIPLAAQHSFSGTILGHGRHPLPGASVCYGLGYCVLADSSGRFSLLSDSSEQTVTVSCAGYASLTLLLRKADTSLVIQLSGATQYPEVVVQAFDSRLRLSETPAAVGVLLRPELSRFANTGFVAALNTVSGVKMDERSPGSYRLSIRGNLLRSPFGIRNVKMYWDGIPFTDAGGTTYFNQVDFNEIGRMEIVRGPAGSIYGAGTGGTVLLYSALPDSAAQSISISSLAGLYETAGLSVALARAKTGGTMLLRYSHIQSDGWRQHTRMQRDKLFFSGSCRTGKHSELRALLFYSRLAYQTPGGITQSQMDSAARQSRPASGSFSSAAAQQAGISLNTAYAGFSHQYVISNRWSNSTAIYLGATQTLNPSILNYQEKQERGIGGRSFFRYHSNRIQFHLGAEFQHAFTKSAVFGNKGGTPDTLQYRDEIRSLQLSFFAQLLYRLPGNFQLQAGLSYNRFAYGFTRLNRQPVIPADHTFSPQLVPRIALSRVLNGKFSAYAALSKGYSPPSIDEVVPSTGQFNASLRAETALNAEAGLRMAFLNGKLVGDLSLYRLQLRQTIVLQRDASGADYFENAGGTLQHGLEMGIQYAFPMKTGSFVNRANARIGLTLQQSNFTEYRRSGNDFSGNLLPGVPVHVLAGAWDISTRNRYALHLTLNHTGAIVLNDANSATAPGYLLMHLRLEKGLFIGKRLQCEIFGTADNSFNRPFSLGNDLNAAGGRFYNPSAPFNFTAGILLKCLFPAAGN